MNDITRITLIIPVYNEEDNLPVLLDEIQISLAPGNTPWEVLFVDDAARTAV